MRRDYCLLAPPGRPYFGILCLTEENVKSPWLLFEAGALAKAIEEGAVCPYLFDLEVSQITGPLDQFQARKAEKASTLEMVLDISKRNPDPSDKSLLSKRFTAFWPELDTALTKIPREPRTPKTQGESHAPARSEPEILEELVARIRNMDRRFGSLEYDVAQLRESSTSVPLRMTPIREHGRQQTRVNLRIEMNNHKVSEGETFEFWVDDSDTVIRVVAQLAELDVEAYMVDWILVDSVTDEYFVLDKYFIGGSPTKPSLQLTLREV